MKVKRQTKEEEEREERFLLDPENEKSVCWEKEEEG